MIITLALVALLGLASGQELQDDSVDCTRPPKIFNLGQCCDVPHHVIWGNFSESVKTCFQEVKKQDKLQNKARMTDVDGDVDATMETPQEDEAPKSGFREMWNKFVSKIVQLFKQLLKSVMQTMQQAVQYYKHYQYDGCIIECVFRQQGLLTSANKVDKAAVMAYLEKRFKEDPKWLQVADNSLETCLSQPSQIPANQTCQSGASELSACLTQTMFLNCPTWPKDNTDCTRLKQFHDACPDAKHPLFTTQQQQQPKSSSAGPQSTPQPDRYTQH